MRTPLLALMLLVATTMPGPLAASDDIPTFEQLLARPVTLKPELVGVHPRVFVTAQGLDALRERARTSHREQWQKVLADLPAMKGAPPPAPGPQARRSQNNVAFALAGVSLAWAVEQKPEYLTAARAWLFAAIDYEPWGYTYNKPNVDLAAGHLLYAIGWAYDLLHHQLTDAERGRVRASLERHAGLVYDYFSPGGKRKRFEFTQNHNFIPTSGLAVTALALMGESTDAPKWAALARAHNHRASQLLSRDGYYYESMEYWIFSIPWLVHFYDAWEHATGESLWELGPAADWKRYLAHVLLPDGQNVFDFGDIWEGALTRAKQGPEYPRVYPGGTLQSNFNLMYRVAARLKDPASQAVAERYAAFGHSNLEEYWTLIWRDPSIRPAPMSSLPLFVHFEDMGVVLARTSWDASATAVAIKAGPPEGHRVARLLPRVPEWRLSSGHAHPDNGGFIIWADGRYLTGDTGYTGSASARHHNTITVGGTGQGYEGEHDVWERMDYQKMAAARITTARQDASGGVTVQIEAAGVYPPDAGLRQFRRTFTFVAPGRFTVRDEIVLGSPKPVQWFLHSDTPVVSGEGGWIVGRASDGKGPGLKVAFTGSPGQVTTAPTVLMAPGQPGSITAGQQEQRGHHLKLETAPATTVTIDATLELSKGSGL